MPVIWSVNERYHMISFDKLYIIRGNDCVRLQWVKEQAIVWENRYRVSF